MNVLKGNRHQKGVKETQKIYNKRLKKDLWLVYTGWPKMNEGVLIRYNFLFKT